jgi:ribonuclease P protein subunit POP4
MPQEPSTSYAKEVLERTYSPERAEEIYVDRVQRRPLLLRPTFEEERSLDSRQQRQRVRDAKRAEKSRKNQKPKPLSSRQKRALGLYEIPKSQQKWEIFEQLNRMWLGYMREVLGIGQVDQKGETNTKGVYFDAKSAGPLMAAADLHGAEVEVVRCRCVGRVGIRGIVAKETKGTLEIITKQNELKSTSEYPQCPQSH